MEEADVFLVSEQVSGSRSYSDRFLLAAQLEAGDLNRYHELMHACELELQEASIGREAWGFAPGRRIGRAREMNEEMEFCRNVSDIWGATEPSTCKGMMGGFLRGGGSSAHAQREGDRNK